MGHADEHNLTSDKHPDVDVSSLADNQILRYDSGSSKWKNEDLIPDTPPRARMYKSADQSIADSSWVVMQFDTGNYDNGSLIGTNKFEISVDGIYSIKAGQGFRANGTGRRLGLIRLNGAGGSTIAQFRMRAENSLPDLTLWTISTDYELSDGDDIEIWIWQNSGGNLNTVGGLSSHWASICLIG